MDNVMKIHNEDCTSNFKGQTNEKENISSIFDLLMDKDYKDYKDDKD